MKFYKTWLHGSPLVIARRQTEDFSRIKQEFDSHYGCPTGVIRYDREIILSGHAAVEFLKFHTESLEGYQDWTPKNDSRKYWRLPDCIFIEEARRHKTHSDWKSLANGHYQHVRRHRRHLLAACTAHMDRQGDPFGKGYQIYAYEFIDRVVYVGLTCNPKRRHKDHQKHGRVSAKIKSGVSYELNVIASGLMPTPAGKIERETITRYKSNGWTVLNRHKGGSTGQIRTRYTYETLLALARPFYSRKQFNLAHNGAYQYACKHGLIDKLAGTLNWPKHAGNIWTLEKCVESAKNHDYITDWLLADKRAYQAAHRQGWLKQIRKELFTVMKPVKVRWTKEACSARAKHFTSRVNWQYGCRDGSYVTARRKGWLPEIANQLFGKRLHRWSNVVKPEIALALNS